MHIPLLAPRTITRTSPTWVTEEQVTGGVTAPQPRARLGHQGRTDEDALGNRERPGPRASRHFGDVTMTECYSEWERAKRKMTVWDDTTFNVKIDTG